MTQNKRGATRYIAPLILLALITMSAGRLIQLKMLEPSTTNGHVLQTTSGAATWDSLNYYSLKNKPILSVGTSGQVLVSNGTTYVPQSAPWATGNMATANTTQTANRTHAGGGFNWIQSGISDYTLGANTITFTGTSQVGIGAAGGFVVEATSAAGMGLNPTDFYFFTGAYSARTNLRTTSTAVRTINFPDANGTVWLSESFGSGTTGYVWTKTSGGMAWQPAAGASLGTNTSVGVTVTGGMIAGGTVTIPAGQTPISSLPRLLYINGIKAPAAAYIVTGTNFVVTNGSMPFPIAAGDYAEMVFNY
jgi:hypothetical protein